MSELIPWLFLLPPVVVALIALCALGWQRTESGKAQSLLKEGGRHLYRLELDEAERCFREGLKLRPKNHALIGTLASLLVTQERHEEALPMIHEAIAQQPNDARMQLILGRCKHGLGQIDEALGAWDAVPKDSESYLDAQSIIASHHKDVGDTEAAIVILEAAASSDAGNAQQRRELKRELRNLKRPAKAPAAEDDAPPKATSRARRSTRQRRSRARAGSDD